MNVGFIMYSWNDINPDLDSTLRLIHESVKRGHKVSLIYPSEMAIRRTIVWSYCHVIDSSLTYSESPVTFYDQVSLSKEFHPISIHDVIFLRDNPPLDNHVLNFLDTLDGSTLFINSISGLRKANNKIYPATLSSLYDSNDASKQWIPLTTVSRNKEYLKKVIAEYDKDKFILKPMDGFGGSGVILLDKSSETSNYNVNSLLDFYIDSGKNNNYIILQEYIETELKGDVRIIMLDGKPLGSMRRVPAKDDHRSNVHAGGHCVAHKLTSLELELCSAIGQQLVKDGLFLVGLDLMGGKLIEVNVCSPGGFAEINEEGNIKIESNILDFAEEKLKSLKK
jgi:glutathione synthase